MWFLQDSSDTAQPASHQTKENVKIRSEMEIVLKPVDQNGKKAVEGTDLRSKDARNSDVESIEENNHGVNSAEGRKRKADDDPTEAGENVKAATKYRDRGPAGGSKALINYEPTVTFKTR